MTNGRAHTVKAINSLGIPGGILVLVLFAGMVRPGWAQRPATFQPARPTVSPYLNLGTTSSGVSNYQTLVRPLIEEREALRRQWAALEQINQDLRGKSAPPLRQPNAGHFMHYSHYYGAPR